MSFFRRLLGKSEASTSAEAQGENALAPALIAAPQPGREIVLDEEELEAVSKTGGIGGVVKSIEDKRRQFDDPVRGQLEDFAMCDGFMNLLRLAKKRMGDRDFEGAASTCVKVIGLAGTLHDPRTFTVQEAWLLLAEVHARYGDRARAQGLLGEADRRVEEEIERLTKLGPDGQATLDAFRADWQSRRREVAKLT